MGTKIVSMYACRQEKAPNLFRDGHEPQCGCWELNSGSLET